MDDTSFKDGTRLEISTLYLKQILSIGNLFYANKMSTKTVKKQRKKIRNAKKEIQTIPNNLSDIMRANERNIDMEDVIKKEFEKQLEKDEQNDLKFYNIIQDRNAVDTNIKSKPFKSIHSVSDMIQLKGLNVKFFQKKKLNFHEKLARQDIKKKPDGTLLLNEM